MLQGKGRCILPHRLAGPLPSLLPGPSSTLHARTHNQRAEPSCTPVSSQDKAESLPRHCPRVWTSSLLPHARNDGVSSSVCAVPALRGKRNGGAAARLGAGGCMHRRRRFGHAGTASAASKRRPPVEPCGRARRGGAVSRAKPKRRRHGVLPRLVRGLRAAAACSCASRAVMHACMHGDAHCQCSYGDTW